MEEVLGGTDGGESPACDVGWCAEHGAPQVSRPFDDDHDTRPMVGEVHNRMKVVADFTPAEKSFLIGNRGSVECGACQSIVAINRHAG